MTWATLRKLCRLGRCINDYKPFPVSARAYEPLYDTWYWSGDRVDERCTWRRPNSLHEARNWLLPRGFRLGHRGRRIRKVASAEKPATTFRRLENLPSYRHVQMKSGSERNYRDRSVAPAVRCRAGIVPYESTQDIHIQIPARRYAAMGWGGLAYEPFACPWETIWRV